MRLRYTPQAIEHLARIANYIAKQDPSAARRVGARVHETINLLASFPFVGREGVLPGTRELIVPALPYIVVYRIEAAQEEVIILGIYHGAQLRPGQDLSSDL